MPRLPVNPEIYRAAPSAFTLFVLFGAFGLIADHTRGSVHIAAVTAVVMIWLAFMGVVVSATQRGNTRSRGRRPAADMASRTLPGRVTLPLVAAFAACAIGATYSHGTLHTALTCATWAIWLTGLISAVIRAQRRRRR